MSANTPTVTDTIIKKGGIMQEIWKPVVGYENLYEVSSIGRVKSLNYKRSNKEKILKNNLGLNGYHRVTLHRGQRKQYLVHKLVAEAFIPNPENKKFVDHLNTIRTDNRVENLQFVTMTENNNNPITKSKMSLAATKRPPISEETRKKFMALCFTRKSKNRARSVVCTDTGISYESQHAAERATGIPANKISMICNGLRNHHKNTHWRFA